MPLNILVISVCGREDRREHIKKILDGLHFDFIDAVTPHSIEYVQYMDQKPIFSGSPHPVEICCAISHQKAWRNIVALGRPAVILEDDVTLRRGFRQFLAGGEKLKDFALYHLGGMEGLVEAELLVTAREKPPHIIGGNEFRKVIGAEGYLLRTCGYALTPVTAQAILQGVAGRFIVADRWNQIAEMSKLRGMLVCSLVRHPYFSSTSSIELNRILAKSKSQIYKSIVSYSFRYGILFNIMKTSKHLIRRLSLWYVSGMMRKIYLQSRLR